MEISISPYRPIRGRKLALCDSGRTLQRCSETVTSHYITRYLNLFDFRYYFKCYTSCIVTLYNKLFLKQHYVLINFKLIALHFTLINFILIFFSCLQHGGDTSSAFVN